LTTAIRTSTARKQENLVTNSATRVEIEACVGQAADNESLSWDVVVDTSSDDIPSLVGAAIAGNDVDGGQVLAEITRRGVD